MAEWLLLRLPHGAGQDPSWLRTDGRGAALSNPESGSLDLAAARVAGRQVCVLVPGTDVLLTHPELPAKAGAKLQQVVPYALEEQLAEDIDNLHFAIGKRAADSSTTPVAVVAKSLLEGWLAALKSVGIVPESMYCESDLLPENPGQAVALLENDIVVVRPPAGSPVTMAADAVADALELARPSQDEMTTQAGRGLILYTGAAEWQRHSAQVEAVRDRFDGVKVQLLSEGPLTLFAQQLPQSNSINLLQGAYAPQTSHAAGLRAWRIAAILLVALIGLHVIGKAAQLTMLKRTERTVDSSIDQTFRSAMPGEQNSTDARRRMERRLLAAQGGSDQAGLLAALGTLADARNSAQDVSMQALSYREGVLDLKLSGPSADSLDSLTQALRAQGWQADLTSGNVAGSGYEGRIQMKPGSAR
jgi:general secretion pathway protein L